MKRLSKIRFDALASYARKPLALAMAAEVGWFEQGNERVLATLILDRTDNDFGSIILCRDRKGRFRCVHATGFDKSRRRAEVTMRQEMEKIAHQEDAEYHQGDEQGVPPDFFTPIVARDRLSPDFIRVSELEGYSNARGIIEPMMLWYEDADGNFVEQFQTTGFDARIWELYLFATFTEMGYEIDRKKSVPDFVCKGLGVEYCVEATTVNPTRGEGPLATLPDLTTEQGRSDFSREFMPIKYGSALFTKLNKRYWEKANVKGKPLVFAIADFQGGLSMTMSRSGLPIYLYGCDYDWHKDAAGRLHIVPREVKRHRWGSKEIPSGFFNLPGAENISAVVFNNSGTVAKFMRMGLLAGFGSSRVRLVRTGTAVDHDPDASEPVRFQHIVNDDSYSETWVEGFDVFHNPTALHPLEDWMMPGASHHHLLPDKQMQSSTPPWQPLSSMTNFHINTDEATEPNK